MQQHRIISLLSILVMLIIPVIGWFLVAQPQLANAALADEQRADMEVQNAESAAVVAQLKRDSARLPELNNDLNTLRTSIPAGLDSSGYIDGIDALARIAGVSITSLTVEDPTAYHPAEGAAPAGSGDEESSDGDLPPAVVTDPLVTSDNLVAIPVTVGVAGTWNAILKFVDGLQSSPRLFLVTTLTTATVEKGGKNLSGTVGGFIYAIPTGVEGKPRPISTTVKSMTPAANESDEETTGSESEGSADGEQPTPGATNAPAP
jgi:Tfp pilus assembly protein PilO